MSDTISKGGNNKPENLIIILLLISFVIIYAVYYACFLVLPENQLFSTVILTLLLAVISIITINMFLNFTAVITGLNITFPLKLNYILSRMPLSTAVLAGRIGGLSREKIQDSYIAFNNKVIKTKKRSFNKYEIFILLPRCIQNNTCKEDVITDILNCKQCGKCSLALISRAAKENGIKAAVVTGGSRARELLKKINPKAVIAVACERELTTGIADSPTGYVYSVINARPNGPCFNTTVDINEFNEVLNSILRK